MRARFSSRVTPMGTRGPAATSSTTTGHDVPALGPRRGGAWGRVARVVGGDQAGLGARDGVRLRGIDAPARRVVRALVRRRADAVLDRLADALGADACRAPREADA